MEKGLDGVLVASTAREVKTGVFALEMMRRSCHNRIDAVDVDVRVAVEHVEELCPVVANALHQDIATFLRITPQIRENGSLRIHIGSVQQEGYHGGRLAASFNTQQESITALLCITLDHSNDDVLRVDIGYQLLTQEELNRLVTALQTRQMHRIVLLLQSDSAKTQNTVSKSSGFTPFETSNATASTRLR